MWLNKKLKQNDENDQILKRLGKKIEGKKYKCSFLEGKYKENEGTFAQCYIFIYSFIFVTPQFY